MKKTVIAALTIMLAGTILWAQGKPGKGICGTSGSGQCFIKAQELNLNAEQQSNLESMRTAHVSKMQQLHADMQIKRAELNKLQLSENADQAAIDQKIEELMAMKTQAWKQKAAHRQKVRALLSPEQRIIFDAHSAKGRGYGHGTHSKRGANALCRAQVW